MLNKLLEKKKIIMIAAIALIVLIVAVVIYVSYNNSRKLVGDSSKASALDSQRIVNKVGKLIELPKNEEPTLATVSDKSKLVSQPFFNNAQNGDKVLIYAKSKKAIIYRESTNMIIEVAPINIGQNEAKPSVSVSPSPILTPTITPAATVTPDK